MQASLPHLGRAIQSDKSIESALAGLQRRSLVASKPTNTTADNSSHSSKTARTETPEVQKERLLLRKRSIAESQPASNENVEKKNRIATFDDQVHTTVDAGRRSFDHYYQHAFKFRVSQSCVIASLQDADFKILDRQFAICYYANHAWTCNCGGAAACFHLRAAERLTQQQAHVFGDNSDRVITLIDGSLWAVHTGWYRRAVVLAERAADEVRLLLLCASRFVLLLQVRSFTCSGSACRKANKPSSSCSHVHEVRQLLGVTAKPTSQDPAVAMDVSTDASSADEKKSDTARPPRDDSLIPVVSTYTPIYPLPDALCLQLRDGLDSPKALPADGSLVPALPPNGKCQCGLLYKVDNHHVYQLSSASTVVYYPRHVAVVRMFAIKCVQDEPKCTLYYEGQAQGLWICSAHTAFHVAIFANCLSMVHKSVALGSC